MNIIDWSWRISLAFFAHWLVNNTEIWLIEEAGNKVSVINFLAYGGIAVAGTWPLLRKLLFSKKSDLNSKDEDKFSTSQSSKMLMPKRFDGEKTELFSSIYSPTKLDYSNRCVIKWFFKEGDFIPQNSLLLQIKETKSKKAGENAFSIVADRDCILSKRVSKQHIIYGSGALLCELTYTEDDTAQLAKSNSMLSGKKSKADKAHAASTKKDAESKLQSLKQLKDEGLISQSVWEKKQEEIMKDF